MSVLCTPLQVKCYQSFLPQFLSCSPLQISKRHLLKMQNDKILSLCNNVRTKEGSGQGWLVETRVVLLSDQLKQVRTLRVLCTSTLSVASAITLCVRSGCLSRHRP